MRTYRVDSIGVLGTRLMGVVVAIAMGAGALVAMGASPAFAGEPAAGQSVVKTTEAPGTDNNGTGTEETVPLEVGTYAMGIKADPAKALPAGPLTIDTTTADGTAAKATVTDIVWDTEALATAIKGSPDNTVTELTADGTATIATTTNDGGNAGTPGTDVQPTQPKKDQPVTATVEVVPDGLRYYVDSGTGDVASSTGADPDAAPVTIPSPSYDAVRKTVESSGEHLRNDVSDLRHETDHGTNTWGVMGADNTLKRSVTSTNRDETGWYASDKDGSISYYLAGLSKGTYHLTAGAARWDGKDRTIEQSATWKVGNSADSASHTVKGSPIVLDADHALAQGGLDITIDQDNANIVYTLSRPAASAEAPANQTEPAPTIAWLTVVDVTGRKPVVVPVAKITATVAKSSLTVGESTQASAKVEPADATNPAVTWSSSDPKVATVDAATGKVSAIKEGKATIIATATDGTKVSGGGEVTVTAKSVPPKPTVKLTGITVSKNPTKTTYWVGDKLSTAGLEVTAAYSDGTTRKLSADDYTLAVFNSLQAGPVAVKVTLKSDPTKTTTFTVHVKVKGVPDPNLTGGAVRFKDVTSATPHRDDILWLYRTGISKGYAEAGGAVTFGGMRTVVRQDMAAFLYRLAGSPAFDPSKVTNPFLDVTPSTPHYKEILWLGSTGIAKGYADGTFGGMRTVVRQDMAAFLHRFSNVVGGRNLTNEAMPFQDLGPHSPHVEDIGWLTRAGVTKGYAVGGGRYEFGGMRDVVRQDMAAFLHRMAANVLQ